jgi:Smg protein
MDPSVLNVVLYLYEHYLEDETEAPPRAALEHILRSGGVPAPKAARALDWLEAFAARRETPAAGRAGTQRIYAPLERERLSVEARGLLMHLEQIGVLGPGERELVIERALALEEREVDSEELQWVVLLTLFHLPDREEAFARMEDICYAEPEPVTH